MGKLWVEVCLISARGLQRTSLLWKLQWYAVGWIDATNKYCTRVDSSGNANPVWRTKFSTLIDTSGSKFEDLILNVEVYSRDPIFLRERLQGTATIVLKEFLDKFPKNAEVSKPVEEVGSFQLRKRNSNKPQGFVDISIQISEEKEEPNFHPGGSDMFSGNGEGFKLVDHGNGIDLSTEYGSAQVHPPTFHTASSQRPENHTVLSSSYAHPMPFPAKYTNSLAAPIYPPAAGSSYQPPRTPQPPPLPSNVGYIPTFLPTSGNLPPSYINMPSSAAPPGRNAGPGFGVGVGAGALAAGAVIFGDDFMSGFSFPGGLQDANLTIATDPPF